MKRLIEVFVAVLLLGCAAFAEEMTLEGVVTLARAGDPYFFLETSSGMVWRVQGEWIRRTWERGDRVRVAGEISPSETPRMKMKSLEKLGAGTIPEPVHVSIDELSKDLSVDGPALRLYGHVVSVEGVVRDVNRRKSFTQVLIGEGDFSIQVVVPIWMHHPLDEDIKIGANVRAVGVFVYDLTRDPHTRKAVGIDTISVLTHHVSALKVLRQTPFWTTGRLVLVIAALVGVIALVSFWGFMLRRAVARQSARLEESIRTRLREKIANDAVRRERLSLSRDLHDEFQQLLAGSKFLVDTARAVLPSEGRASNGDGRPSPAALLDEAVDSLTYAQSQLRVILWGLTEESEGPTKLLALLEYAVSRLPAWKDSVVITSSGEEPPLARRVSGTLLMILQEALGNAFNRGLADRVEVNLVFGAEGLEMTIRDSGIGFDTKAEVPKGHYGIVSMRERTNSLGGTFRIESKLGEGTCVFLHIPYDKEA